MTTGKKEIARGAEAVLIKSGTSIIKKRVKKYYRHPFLDGKLRSSRTRKEARILERVAELISVPKIKKVGGEEIEMEFLAGKLLSDNLEKFSAAKRKEIAKKIAKIESQTEIMDVS